MSTIRVNELVGCERGYLSNDTCNGQAHDRTTDSHNVHLNVLDRPADRLACPDRPEIDARVDTPREQLILGRSAESIDCRLVNESNQRIGADDDRLVARARKIEMARRRIIDCVDCGVREMRRVIASPSTTATSR